MCIDMHENPKIKHWTIYRGVTDQSETFSFKLTHIRVKHFYMYFSV